MPTVTTYHSGGYQAGAANRNKSSELDGAAGTFTTWDPAGAQTSQRALTGAEVAALAAQVVQRTSDVNKTTLQTKATTAIQTNIAALALPDPTGTNTSYLALAGTPAAGVVHAQVRALTNQSNALRSQVLALTRQNQALIRLAINLLDDTAGT